MEFQFDNVRQAAQVMKDQKQQANLKVLLAKGFGKEHFGAPELSKAYESLTTENKKALYDLARQINTEKNPGATFQELREDAPFFDSQTGYMLYRDGSLDTNGEHLSRITQTTKPLTQKTSNTTIPTDTNPQVTAPDSIIPTQTITPDTGTNIPEDSTGSTSDQTNGSNIQINVPQTEPGTNIQGNDTIEELITRVVGPDEPDEPTEKTEDEPNTLLKRSEALIGKQELDLYKNYLSKNPSSPDIINGIKSFQEKHGLNPDGIIGPKTLKALYLHAYRGDTLTDFSSTPTTPKDGFGSPVRKKVIDQFRNNPTDPVTLGNLRIMTYQELMGAYGEKGGLGNNNKYRADTPYFHRDDVFKNAYFYGNGSHNENPIRTLEQGIVDTSITGNIPATLDTFKALYPKLAEKTHTTDVSYMIRDRDGKYISIDYRQGNLYFASLITPGTEKNPSPKGALTVGGIKNLAHYFTDDDAKTKQFMDQSDGAMAYSVGTNKAGIYRHNGPTNGILGSHGCFRLPTLYAMLNFESPAKTLLFEPNITLR